MKKVDSFQTSDNKLFTDKIEALNHEFALEIAGAIQVLQAAKNDTVTVRQVAAIITKNSPEFSKIISKYRGQITSTQNRINAKNLPSEPVIN